MKLINSRTNDVIADRAVVAGSFLKRLKGMLGQQAMAGGTALVLKPCRSIHTFFMRFSVDAVFLDRRGVVIHLITDMPPSRVSPVVNGSVMVVEFPGGTVKNRLLSGDTLIFSADAGVI